jgi:hypothetical protein
MWIEETWPSTKELVGLQFENADDFRECWLLAMERPEAFRWTSWDDLTVEVRITEKHLVDELGVAYTEFRLVDLDDLPMDERQRLQREGVQDGMKILLERLRGEHDSE